MKDLDQKRRTALVSKELSRYNIDIAALSETRLLDDGELEERASGYTFFWRGKPQDARRESGVGFAIKSGLVKQLVNRPTGIGDRILHVRIQIDRNLYATMISVYAPTMMNDVAVIESFYSDLNQLLSKIPSSDKIFLLGDFNARVGMDYTTWKGVVGRHGVGNSNSNGLLLLSTCATHQLVITNTLFRLKDKFKTSWMHPRSHHWHLLDYVITRKKDQQDVKITRAMRGAECWTDHRLIRSKLNLVIRPKINVRNQKPQKRFDVRKLQGDEQMQQRLNSELSQAHFEQTYQNGEAHWAAFKDSTFKVVEDVVGFSKRKHQDWFDENDNEISALLEQKNAAYRAWLSDPLSERKHVAFKNLRLKAQIDLRKMRNNWWINKSAELQQFFEEHDSKSFFNALKEVYGPTAPARSPLRSADGCLLTDDGAVMDRWREHFQELFNRPSLADPDVVTRIPQHPVVNEMDDPPTVDEIRKAITHLRSGKAPGQDGIPPEIYKVAEPTITPRLHALFTQLWTEGEVPQDFKDAQITCIYKKEGRQVRLQ